MSEQPWHLNYFNYFTEVEEHFRRARGTGLFLLSPLDWALIEAWKNAGIPLEAVIRGIDVAFEKWRTRKKRGRLVNSLAYCAQAVSEEAQTIEGGSVAQSKPPEEPPFSQEDLENHLRYAIARIHQPDLAGVRQTLETILSAAAEHYSDLQGLESRLSGLEDKMIAVARAQQSEQDLMQARADLDRQLRPYRGRLSAPQLAMLEKQYLDRWLLEKLDLPRVSLFYLR
jgi:hypothetical protein